jgi:hypothetical protein
MFSPLKRSRADNKIKQKKMKIKCGRLQNQKSFNPKAKANGLQHICFCPNFNVQNDKKI